VSRPGALRIFSVTPAGTLFFFFQYPSSPSRRASLLVQQPTQAPRRFDRAFFLIPAQRFFKFSCGPSPYCRTGFRILIGRSLSFPFCLRSLFPSLFPPDGRLCPQRTKREYRGLCPFHAPLSGERWGGVVFLFLYC